MSDWDDLARELILDHSRSPRNCRALAGVRHQAEGDNPLCGDRVRVFVDVVENTIRDIAFEGSGCPISMASASLMTESVMGKSLADAEQLFQRFQHALTGFTDEVMNPAELGKLAVFEGVRKYPMRVKCATLAWHTLHAALQGDPS